MEANFFRLFCAELAPELVGARIEKIWSPAPGAWTLGFGGGGGKRFLMMRPRPAPGLLFLSASRPENPLAPPARAMWLRKRLLGRRVVGLAADWSRLPYDLIEKISTRITNEVREVNRVVLDITSKPPGTIEWE